MAGNLHESYHGKEEFPLPSEKSTGIVFAVVSAILAYFLSSSQTALYFFSALALGFLLLAFLAPKLLTPLNRAWFKFSILLSKIMNPVVMAIIFGLVIVPAGLIMKLFYDPLKSNKGKQNSYWIDRTKDQQGSMKNQF